MTGSVVELAALVGHEIFVTWTSLGRTALAVTTGPSARALALGTLTDSVLAQMLHITITHHLDMATEKTPKRC